MRRPEFYSADLSPSRSGSAPSPCFRWLVEGAGTPISKATLIESAWPGLAIEDSNLTVQIAALRRVFAEESGGEKWIETLPRRGYRYVGPVPAKEDHSEASAADAPIAATLALPDKPSLAVLPFTNMSGDPEQDYFADGMVEDIITGLSRIKWLFVVARNSSFTYKGQSVSVSRVGRELGVRYLLEGSVRKVGRQVRITGQLVEAETGVHIWADRYDRALDDVFALQDEMTLNVVGAIQPSLREAEIERVKRKRPESLDAYDLALRAIPHVFVAIPTEAEKAMPFLERALTIESDYAIAHGLLAWCHEICFLRRGYNPEHRDASIRHQTPRSPMAATMRRHWRLADLSFRYSNMIAPRRMKPSSRRWPSAIVRFRTVFRR